MEYLIGIAGATAACVIFGMLAGFDRERVFYPMMLPPIATYYILFAAMGGSAALPAECVAALPFLLGAIVGFKKNLWWTAAAIAGHGVFDFFHSTVIQNPGVPAWWPGFCGAFDVLAGGFLAMLLAKRPGFAVTEPR